MFYMYLNFSFNARQQEKIKFCKKKFILFIESSSKSKSTLNAPHNRNDFMQNGDEIWLQLWDTFVAKSEILVFMV